MVWNVWFFVNVLYFQAMVSVHAWTAWVLKFCGLYFKHVTIINDNSSAVSKWSFKLIDDPRVIIYDHHRLIIQATELISDIPLLPLLWVVDIYRIYKSVSYPSSKLTILAPCFFSSGHQDFNKVYHILVGQKLRNEIDFLKKQAIYGPRVYPAGQVSWIPSPKITCNDLEWSSKFWQDLLIPSNVIQPSLKDRIIEKPNDVCPHT
jgi:hypothetical protein